MDFRKRYIYNTKQDLLGKGGFSRVFKATDVLLDREVALKFFNTEQSAQYDLITEIKKVIKFQQENLCSYYDVAILDTVNAFGEEEQVQVGVMELLEGGELKSYLKKNPQYLNKLLCDVLKGLSYLHKRGIIHRDLKPQNILIKLDDDGPVAKITDFGISKAIGVSQENVSALVGTVEYMAPEQFNPSKYGINGQISTHLDLWSFGIMMYELIEGENLFGSRSKGTSAEVVMTKILNEDYHQKVALLPQPYNEVVGLCLKKRAGERAASADIVLNMMLGSTVDSRSFTGLSSQTSNQNNDDETALLPGTSFDMDAETQVISFNQPVAKKEPEKIEPLFTRPADSPEKKESPYESNKEPQRTEQEPRNVSLPPGLAPSAQVAVDPARPSDIKPKEEATPVLTAKEEPAPVVIQPKQEPAPDVIEPKVEPVPVVAEAKVEPAPIVIQPKEEPAPVVIEPKAEVASVIAEPKVEPAPVIIQPKEEPAPVVAEAKIEPVPVIIQPKEEPATVAESKQPVDSIPSALPEPEIKPEEAKDQVQVAESVASQKDGNSSDVAATDDRPRPVTPGQHKKAKPGTRNAVLAEAAKQGNHVNADLPEVEIQDSKHIPLSESRTTKKGLSNVVVGIICVFALIIVGGLYLFLQGDKEQTAVVAKTERGDSAAVKPVVEAESQPVAVRTNSVAVKSSQSVTDRVFNAGTAREYTYTGKTKNDLPDGQGVQHLADGSVYKGGFSNGQYSGRGALTWANGDKYVGNFSSGKKTSGTFYYRDGSLYKGSFRNEQRHGKGKLIYNDGSYYEGEFANDDFNGQGVVYDSNGEVTKSGTFSNGDFQG